MGAVSLHGSIATFAGEMLLFPPSTGENADCVGCLSQ
ncbi:hypothetical protein N475_25665 [Pseudoalteromonas luteoviolacea DSM 6061]|uniref:Uncharacterized protein n=1 Tax=Pseudoalteromonas luteoviolacea DSM 6061 TaxID=1365250 RepID=A0A167BDL1_9GAMM|nr:hypothetical protein N475_25665 [Pseudoalteromonas luteoviolacea DSM 6061]